MQYRFTQSYSYVIKYIYGLPSIYPPFDLLFPFIIFYLRHAYLSWNQFPRAIRVEFICWYYGEDGGGSHQSKKILDHFLVFFCHSNFNILKIRQNISIFQQNKLQFAGTTNVSKERWRAFDGCWLVWKQTNVPVTAPPSELCHWWSCRALYVA